MKFPFLNTGFYQMEHEISFIMFVTHQENFFVESRTQEGTACFPLPPHRTCSHWAKRGTMNFTKSSTILLVVHD
jgi:hypothetical protein